MTQAWDVHGAFTVELADSVSRQTRQAVQFHLGALDQPAGPAPRRLQIQGFGLCDVEPVEEFHLTGGIRGQAMVLPDERFALEQRDNGWRVSVDLGDGMLPVIMQWLNVEAGRTAVHAAGVVRPDGRAILLPGAGGVGKTAVIGRLVRDHGWRVLGDDIVFVSAEGVAYGMPRPFILKPYHHHDYPEVFEQLGLRSTTGRRALVARWRPRIIRALRDNLPLRGMVKSLLVRLGLFERIRRATGDINPPEFLAAVPIQDVFGPGSVASEAPVTDWLFLVREHRADLVVDDLDPDDLRRRLIAIIHHEWVAYARRWRQAEALGLVDPIAYGHRLEEILASALADASPRLVRIPVAAHADAVADIVLAA